MNLNERDDPPSISLFDMFDYIEKSTQTLKERSDALKIQIQTQEHELIETLQTLKSIDENLSRICNENDKGALLYDVIKK